ncbi:MAG TPA: phosphatase PAP2 family protein [Gemmatimonadaceae bacterium]|nr:phosphatase PAP2 family protein [Gemmatimonadaceae bacterium]
MRPWSPALLLALALGCTRSGAAQTVRGADTSAAAAATDTGRAARAPLVSRGQGELFAIALGATAAIAALDRYVRSEVRELAVSRNRALDHVAVDLSFAGGPGPFLTGGALFAAGYALRRERTADLGVHLTEGVILAAALDGVVKGFAGRALPRASGGDPDKFSFGRGFHEGNGPYVSFPSGHTAAAFAAAAVITGEAARWDSGGRRIVEPVAYGGATLVALSRLYEDVHWASDLPLGAAIGIWSGMTVVSRAHSRRRNRLRCWLLATTVIPSRNGGVVAWSWGGDAPGW